MKKRRKGRKKAVYLVGVFLLVLKLILNKKRM